jgi:hypothetical protein
MFGDVLLAGDNRLLSHDGDDLSGIFLYWQDFTFTEMPSTSSCMTISPPIATSAARPSSRFSRACSS